MDLLLKGLNGKPNFNIITGPVNSGKSLLLLKLQEKLESAHVPVLNINMRQISFNSVDTLVSTLVSGMDSWFKKFKEAVENTKIDASLYGFQLHAELEKGSVPPITKLNILFAAIQDKLPPHTFWYGARAPVFIVDEANELSAITKATDGNDSLHNFFKWLILNTKEKNRFHVLLASSDSFFHLWVSKYIGTTRYETYVIGDLSEQEAKEYWKYLIEKFKYSHLPLPSFQTVYDICKGNMFLIERALHYWHCEHFVHQKVHWHSFPYVIQEMNKLLRAYYQGGEVALHANKSPPLWEKDHLNTIVRKLVDSDGVVKYAELCKDLRPDIIDSFIEHNIVHLRPTARSSYDLPARMQAFPDVPLVTSESGCSLIAMKYLIQHLDEK